MAQTLKTQEFRPFYDGYAKGTVRLYENTWYPNETRGITREWNLEGWNIKSFIMVIRFAILPWELSFRYEVPQIVLSFSFDNGTTWPIEKTIPSKWYGVDWSKTWGWAECQENPSQSGWVRYVEHTINFNSTEAKTLFTPKTMIRFKLIGFWDIDPNEYWHLCVAYWGENQKPIPPYDYRDPLGAYAQYYIKTYVEYTEETIEYKGQTINFNYEETKRRLSLAANSILKCMHPSGAINEVVNKKFGTDSWIVIYSSQLAVINLIDLCKAIPENNATYLLAAKRFIVWMWSKQWNDGSFPFILTDGDQHCWYNETADLWYGYDKIDSFSALAITLMAKYYNATQDLDFINQYWDQIEKSKQFLYNLINTTYFLPYDGYHYDNDTGYELSDLSLLHDSCEVYQAFKDIAYLYNVRGNSSEANYYNTFADSIANGIRTHFWNETLQRYVGVFNMTSGKQDTTRIYSMITPVIYGVENNKNRAISTVNEYIQWGILSGRYYEKQWAADYSIYNEYSTMSGMIISAFHKLNTKFNYNAKWMKDKLIEITKFLFMNPVYPNRDLQNENGILDFVNLVNYTWAKDYARLVETNAWFINAFLNLDYSLYIYNQAEKQQIKDFLDDQDSFWQNQTKEFQQETGYVWNEGQGYNKWIEWLKQKQLYVSWYDYMFLKQIYDYLDEEPWWEALPPHQWPEYPDWLKHIIFTLKFPNLILPLMGAFGLFLLIGSPYYIIRKIKDGEYIKGLGWGVIMFMVSIGLIIAWLWP